MGFKGSLESINLADIFQNLSLNQQSGTLRIVDNEIVRYIYFDKGQVRYLSRGRGRGLELEEIMTGRGLATKADIERAGREAQSSGQSTIDALVSANVVSADQVNDLAQIRIEEDIYDLFGWSSGQFEFLDGPPPSDVFDSRLISMQVMLNTNSLIMEAARRIDEWERIREKIPSTRESFILNEGAGEGEDLTPIERRVLELLDGTRDVDDLVTASTFSRYEVASALCRFLDLNWIRPATVDELRKAVSSARYRGEIVQTVKLYEKILSLGDEDLQARTDLAEACATIGDNEKAAIHFGVVADSFLADEKEDDALKIYNKVIQLVPKHVPSRDKLARIYAERGMRREALENYRILVNSYIDTGRTEQAKAACSAALAIDPQNMDIRGSLAKVYLSEGNREAAVAEFEAVADALAASNKPRAAADLYRRILRIDKRQIQIRDKLASVLSMDQEYRAARTKGIVVKGMVLVILLVAAGVVGWEGYVKYKVDEGIAQANKLIVAERLGPAEKILLDLRKYPSLMKWPRAVDAELERIRRIRQEMARGRIRVTERQREEIESILRAARKLRRDQKLPEVIAELDKIDPLNPSPEQKARADALRDEVQVQMDYVANYAEKAADFAKRLKTPALDPDERLDLLKAEYKLKRGLMRAYQDSPEAKGLVLPLMIRTKPEGCIVYINGKMKAPAPYIHRYRPNEELLVAARKDGYKEERSSVRLHGSALLDFVLRRETAWSTDVGSPVYGTPLVVGGQVLVATRNGRIVALDAGTGEKRWDERLPGLIEIEGALSGYKGKIFFGDNHGFVYALDPKVRAKRLLWSHKTGGAIKAAPVVVPVALFSQRPYVFVGSEDGKVYCLDADTGERNRNWNPPPAKGPIRTTPLVTDRTVYVGSDDYHLYAYDITNGNSQGKFRASGMVRGSPVMADGRICIGDTEGRLYALVPKPRLSGYKWKFSAGGDIVSTPVVADGEVYFGTKGGRLHALDAENGDSLWAPFAAGAEIRGSPAVSQKRVYFGATDSRVYALDRRTGKIVWKYPTNREIRAGVAFANGMLYVASTDGFIYAFREE